MDKTRESVQADVQRAFRKVARKVHPDKSGSAEDTQGLNAARDAWQAAAGGPSRGLPRPAAAPAAAVADPNGVRMRSEAVLLTYQSWAPEESAAGWDHLCNFVTASLAVWMVKHWTATLETNSSGSHHVHLMLLFHKPMNCLATRMPALKTLTTFLGKGVCKKRLQQPIDIDRGVFYVWANKVGSVRVAASYELAGQVRRARTRWS